MGAGNGDEAAVEMKLGVNIRLVVQPSSFFLTPLERASWVSGLVHSRSRDILVIVHHPKLPFRIKQSCPVCDE